MAKPVALGPVSQFNKNRAGYTRHPSIQRVVNVHIVTQKHLNLAAEQYPDAAKQIAAWHRIAKSARWRNFIEVRQVLKDADDVKGHVVFNILRNRYRLMTIIHYSRERDGRLTEGHIYIRSFLTHQQYDHRTNWDKGVTK